MKIIGHRGARGLAPENTIAALLKALEYGVDEVEFDLRVTKDGVVILHHDPEVTDPDGQKLMIAEADFEVLKAHKADLATFEEAIGAINRAKPMLVEVKPDVPTEPIIKIIKAYLNKGWQNGDLLLGSFSQKTLRELHKALPEIEKVVIEKWSGVRASWHARELGTKRLSMNQKWLWRGFISSMRRSGWELYPYTLNDLVKAKRWARYGIVGVITDFPDRFK